MPSTLNSNCNVCGISSHLSKCAACKVTFYCSKEHQVSDRPSHKTACNGIKKAETSLASAEAKLRAEPGDNFATPAGATIFEDYAGRFWGILATRPYMRARYALVEALLKIKTRAAAQAALDHILDMLRLCRSDNMGVRNLVPALYLRLGRDQECYDFVKWYATEGQRGDYDWGDMENGFLDLKDEDAFEPTKVVAGQYAALAPSAAITLLKIRLLFDVQALQGSAAVGSRVPQEVLDQIRSHMVGDIVAKRQDIIESKDLQPVINKLSTQVSEMYHCVKNSNKHFWPAVLRPGHHLTARPEAYSKGSVAEMQLVLQYSYDSWRETEKAIEMIGKLVAADKE